jgi:hypothetical protein
VIAAGIKSVCWTRLNPQHNLYPDSA